METMVMIFACKASRYNYIRQQHNQHEICKQFELIYRNLVYLENGNSKIIFEIIYLGDDRYKGFYNNDDYRKLVRQYIKVVCMGNLECLTEHLF